MSIKSSEEALFREWRPIRPGFVSDGVADEKSYLSSGKRILFVLKEANDPDGGEWDLREYMQEGARPHTWNNITRWVEGIRNIPTDLSWCDLEQVDFKRRRESLKTIAVINLKKSPGSHTSNPIDVAIAATQDKELLNRQVALYDADLTILCGVSDLFHSVVSFDKPPEWKTTSRGVRYHEHAPGKIVIDYVHPEARVSGKFLHYALVDAIREITTKI